MTDCLECPTPENYAAVALQLQETAFQTEACLFELERSLRAAVNRPTLIRTSTAPVSVAAFTFQQVGVSSTTLTYANSTLTDINIFSSFPSGIWHVGANMTQTASGVVDANTYRFLIVRVRNLFAPSTEPDVFSALTTVREANNGTGMDLTLSAVVVVEEGQTIGFEVANGNGSSNVNVGTGALYWATRLSDINNLRTV